MTTELMISMLKQTNTGTELLAVLDTLVDDSNADVAGCHMVSAARAAGVTLATVPTLEEIAF